MSKLTRITSATLNGASIPVPDDVTTLDTARVKPSKPYLRQGKDGAFFCFYLESEKEWESVYRKLADS